MGLLASEIALKIIKSVAIIFIGFVLHKLTRALIKKMLKPKEKDSLNSQRKYETLSVVLNSVIKYIIFFFVLCEVLYFFDVDIKSIITLAGISGLTISLGAQNLIKDLITGVFILFEDQFGVGDEVVICDKTGVVKSITLRTTILENDTGDIYIIPNSEIKIVTNKSRNK